jgi:hypothetical protein
MSAKKRTAAEVWQALETMELDDAAEREMDRVAAMTPEEVRRELAEAGFDPEESRARGVELARAFAQQQAAPVVPAPARRRPSRRAVALLLAAAFGLLAVVMWRRAENWIAHNRDRSAPDIGPDTPSPEWIAHEKARARAIELRRGAQADCTSAHWEACLKGLDEARDLDPAGEADPTVVDERRTASDALSTPPPNPHTKP